MSEARGRIPPAVFVHGWQEGEFRVAAWRRDWQSGETAGDAIHEALVFRFLPCLSGHTLRAIFRRPAARRRSAFRTPLPIESWVPLALQKARLGTWEPGLSLRLRQWVTRPIREFTQRRLHHVSEPHHRSSDSSARTPPPTPPTTPVSPSSRSPPRARTRTRRPASTTATPSGTAASSGASWPNTRRP